MRLISLIKNNGTVAVGIVQGSGAATLALDLSHPAFASLLGNAGHSMLDFIALHTPDLLQAIEAVTDKERALIDLAHVQTIAALPNPRKIVGAAFNYKDALDEKQQEYPSEPVIFIKSASTIIGDGEPIVLPDNATQTTYEAELAVVIGRQALNIAPAQVMDHVFGYAIFNDVSVSEFVRADKNFVRGKNQQTSGPLGSIIVDRDGIADPHQLNISLTLNGEVLQKSSTSKMLFRIPELISYISSKMPLDVGDIVATGTPAGVAASYQPGKWLKDGDEVVINIEHIGQLSNRVHKRSNT
ncbi:fumarylacetoacetate hydrolase family protein [Paralcaligenes ginsengisoli]